VTSVNDYRFVTHWRVEATCEEVFAILSDATEYPRWWPRVYLEVRELRPAAAEPQPVGPES